MAFEGWGQIGAVIGLGDAVDDLGLLVGLCSIRLYAALLIMPATGEQFLQGLLRNGLVVILGGYIAFGLPPEHLVHLSAVRLVGLVVKEALLGLLLGFIAATVFWTAECVGALIDTQTGYNSVQLNNPMSGEQSTPVSGLLQQLVMAVFYTLGGMLLFLGGLFESFKVWPLMAELPSLGAISEMFLVQQADSLMAGALKFAAPVLLVLVLVDLGLGLMTKAADKLEPASLAQPIKGALAMLMLSLLTGIFIEQVRRFLLPSDLLQRLQTLLA